MSKFHLLCVQKIFKIPSFRLTKGLICQCCSYYYSEKSFFVEKRYHNLKITSFCHEFFFYSDWKWNWRLILLFSEEKGFFSLFALLIILAFFPPLAIEVGLILTRGIWKKSFFIIFLLSLWQLARIRFQFSQSKHYQKKPEKKKSSKKILLFRVVIESQSLDLENENE